MHGPSNISEVKPVHIFRRVEIQPTNCRQSPAVSSFRFTSKMDQVSPIQLADGRSLPASTTSRVSRKLRTSAGVHSATRKDRPSNIYCPPSWMLATAYRLGFNIKRANHSNGRSQSCAHKRVENEEQITEIREPVCRMGLDIGWQ